MGIILYKAVKELNIGTATAVEKLAEGGFIIENKPRSKLTEEAYHYLLSKCGIKPPLDQKDISGEKSLLPLEPFSPFSFAPDEDEDGITSFKVLEHIRRKVGIPKSVFKYFPKNENSLTSLREHYCTIAFIQASMILLIVIWIC